MTNRKNPATSGKISDKTRCRFIASNANELMAKHRPAKQMLLLPLMATTCFALMFGCTTAPVAKPSVARTPRIVPAVSGFVVCAVCDTFLPTPKHLKTPTQINETVPASSVPATLSIAPNEQIVSANAINSTIKPSSISIFFEISQARIRPAEALKLRAFLRTVDVGGAFAVTGYTDATGNPASNKRLANRRAIAVKEFVVHNTSARRVEINEAPACCSGASDKTSAERATNRHVNLEVSP